MIRSLVAMAVLVIIATACGTAEPQGDATSRTSTDTIAPASTTTSTAASQTTNTGAPETTTSSSTVPELEPVRTGSQVLLSLIHISEPTRPY